MSQACADTDTSCLCTANIFNGLQACDQCMFENLVAMNMKAPDVRVASNPAMSGMSVSQ